VKLLAKSYFDGPTYRITKPCLGLFIVDQRVFDAVISSQPENSFCIPVSRALLDPPVPDLGHFDLDSSPFKNPGHLFASIT
jgi:hypothetical protein